MRSDREPNAFERCINGLPLFMSYLILGSTWLGFIGVVSFHEVLLKRGEMLHFFLQQIVFNSLCGLCTLSLIIASTRSPGTPDSSLTPPYITRPRDNAEKNRTRALKSIRNKGRPAPIQPPLPGVDGDDIPLRFLRNSQWVSSRIGKDRPSPLPVTSNRLARPFAGASTSLPSDDGAQPISPFPVNVNPLVPHNAKEAGEDRTERDESAYTARAIEGHDPVSLSDSPSDTEEVDEAGAGDRLLAGQQRGRRSIMSQGSDGAPRWCRKCDAWKPDRTHHCRFCKRCILKMDHHCVWLGTCVGFHNYKPFLLFITYGTLLSLYGMIESGYESFRFFQDPDDFFPSSPNRITNLNGTCIGTTCDFAQLSSESEPELDPAPIVFLAITFIGAMFALAVGSLMGYHWYLACNNITTLENLSYSYPSVLLEAAETGKNRQSGDRRWKPDHLLSRSDRNRLRREARDINVYDLGWRKNLKSVFGDRSTFLAFWPMFRAYRKHDRESGHFFDIDEDKLERLRQLTMELRCGAEEVQGGYRSEYGDDTDDEETDNEDHVANRDSMWDEPRTGSSGGNGDDELSEEETSRPGARNRKSAWFDEHDEIM